MRRIPLDEVELFGEDLDRPEGVVVAADGTVWAADGRGACTAIAPDGSGRRLGDLGGQPNGICLDREGNVIIANIGGGRVQRLFPDGRHEVIAERVGSRPLNTPNFPVVDSRGNVYVTNSSWRAEIEAIREPAPDGALVRVSPDGRIELLAEGFYFANGLALAEDESAIFLAQTMSRNVLRLPLRRDGTVGPAEQYGPELGPLGFPDGLALDSRGNLYVTLVGMHAIGVITPEGELEIILEDPEGKKLPNPTNIAFGGPDLRDAYLGTLVTTSLPRFRAEFPGLSLVHQR